jgi:hypothetical protein
VEWRRSVISNVNYPGFVIYDLQGIGEWPSMTMLQIESRGKTTYTFYDLGELQIETCVGYIVMQI